MSCSIAVACVACTVARLVCAGGIVEAGGLRTRGGGQRTGATGVAGSTSAGRRGVGLRKANAPVLAQEIAIFRPLCRTQGCPVCTTTGGRKEAGSPGNSRVFCHPACCSSESGALPDASNKTSSNPQSAARQVQPAQQGLNVLDPKEGGGSGGGRCYYAWSRPRRWAFCFY